MPWDRKHRAPSDYLPQSTRLRVLRDHEGICHLCHHPGATEVDHIVPWSQWVGPIELLHDDSNLAPAHAGRCPWCRRRCHRDKSEQERLAALEARRSRGKRPARPHPGTIRQ